MGLAHGANNFVVGLSQHGVGAGRRQDGADALFADQLALQRGDGREEFVVLIGAGGVAALGSEDADDAQPQPIIDADGFAKGGGDRSETAWRARSGR